MMTERYIHRHIFEEYEKEVQKVAKEIKEDMKENDEDTFDGREWCEENDIPENVFADAIDWNYEWFDYGVSPMYPWSVNKYD